MVEVLLPLFFPAVLMLLVLGVAALEPRQPDDEALDGQPRRADALAAGSSRGS